MPCVSIIVPIHNSADYLPECLASIERQTLRDIEIICVDDASSDESVTICRLFAEDDDRFKLITLPENMGVSEARNRGIEAAQGEFLLFMDSDDWYPNDETVEHLYRAAVQHGVSIAGGEMVELNVQTGEMRTDYHDDWHLQLYHFDHEGIVDYRDWQGDFGFTRFIYKRDLIMGNNIRFPSLIRHEDPVFFVKAMVAAGRFYALHEPTYKYRVHHKSYELTDQAIDDAIDAHIELFVIADRHDLPILRDYLIGTLKWYLMTQAPDVRKHIEAIDAVYQSHSYRLGAALLAPLRWLKDSLARCD